jgi:hypothetical protein
VLETQKIGILASSTGTSGRQLDSVFGCSDYPDNVHRFVDRDMLMRYHWGMAPGHLGLVGLPAYHSHFEGQDKEPEFAELGHQGRAEGYVEVGAESEEEDCSKDDLAFYDPRVDDDRHSKSSSILDSDEASAQDDRDDDYSFDGHDTNCSDIENSDLEYDGYAECGPGLQAGFNATSYDWTRTRSKLKLSTNTRCVNLLL